MLSREAGNRQRPRRPIVRTLNRRATALAVVCTALAAAGCGSDSDSEDEDSPSAAGTSLEVTLDIDGEQGDETARTGSVACESQADCPGAESLTPADFEPVPAETACTEIFGGPETAMITGSLAGEPVESEFSRANGCEIKHFDRFVSLLQSVFPDYRPGEALTP